MKNFNDYQAILFDWDGTLVDTCGLILDAHNHVRAHYDLPLWTMDRFLGQASQSAREYYPTVYGDKAEEAQKILYDFVEAHHLTYIEPMDNVIEILDFIKGNAKPLGVVSNKRHATLNLEMDQMGWRSYFKTVIGAGVAEKDKPSKAPIIMAVQEIDKNIDPKEILYIGDTETDLLCAQNVGCDVAFIQSDKERPDLIEKYQPRYRTFSLSELLANFKSEMK